LVPACRYLCDRRLCETIRPREFAIGTCESRFVVQSSRQRRRKAEHFVRPAVLVCDVIRTAVGILARHRWS